EGFAEAPVDHLARLRNCTGGDRDRIGPHVGDQANLALSQRDAFVQRLRRAHCSARAKAELARRLLLQRAGGERRRRRLATLCTRPAERPRRILLATSGLSL